MEPGLPLEGLYLHLVRHGFPLAVRDYQDALSALEAGHGLHRRDAVQWLCETLWARTEEEQIQLARLFRDFPPPTAEVVEEATGTRRGTEGDASVDRSKRPPERRSDADAESGPVPIAEFASPQETGLGLPRAQVPPAALQPFILTPRPAVSLRALIVIWRRFRLPRRSGPRTELYLEATIREQSRRGTLVEPVYVAARANQARLLVLFDASPSMAPWRSLGRTITDSLKRSQLGHTALYYFNNDPTEALFETDRLVRPTTIEDAQQRHPDCALLVITDAGAARGRLDRDRVAGTRRFLASTAGSSWWPIAWVNPLPPRRWAGSSAARIAALPGATMFELSEDGMVRAVDFLRGNR